MELVENHHPALFDMAVVHAVVWLLTVLGETVASEEFLDEWVFALAADHQHRIVEYLQRPFHLRAEIHMARRIEKRYFRAAHINNSLSREDGDAAFLLLRIAVEKRVAVVHASCFSDGAALVQYRL